MIDLSLTNVKYHALKPVHFIVRLCQYAPIIWHDVDWDYSSIFDLLQYKLRRMVKSSVRWHHTDSDKARKQMLVCANLLSRLSKQAYVDQQTERHFQKYRKYKITDRLPEEGYKEIDKIAKHEVYMVNQDLDFLFKLLRKNIQKWWD